MNTLLNISMITREALRVLKNQLVFASTARRDYDDKFAVAGAKIGTTLNVRKPPRYIGRRGQALQLENAVEEFVPVRLTTQYGCDIQFSSADLTLSIDDFSRRFITPAIATVANAVDWDGLQLFKKIYSSTNVSTPGTSPTSITEYARAGVRLDEQAAPMDGERYIVLCPDAQFALISNLTTLFNPSADISTQYRKGTMGQVSGFQFRMDQNVGRLTCGTRDNTTPIVATTSSNGDTSISVSGLDASVTIEEGAVFTVADCYSVNPQSRARNSALQQFVVTAATSADGAGAATIPVAPAIYFSGPLQTVDSAPTAAKALVFVGTASTSYAQNLAYHRDAFCLASADLELPGGTDMASRVSEKDSGLSLRLIRQYNISTDQWPCRLDFLAGWAVLRPELACRIWSL